MDVDGDAETLMDVALALGDLMARCGDALESVQVEVAAAVWGTERLLGGAGCAGAVGDGIRVVTGRAAMARVLAQANGEPVGGRLSLYSSTFAGGVGRQSAVDRRLASEGVRLRAVYQKALLSEPVEPPPVGVEVRCADLVPVDMVVDERTALLPVYPDRPGIALIVVTDPAWVQMARVLAESCWVRAEGRSDVC